MFSRYQRNTNRTPPLTTHAKLAFPRSAALSSDFGLDYATRLFGEEALADLPRFSRGKNAGKLKGFVRWIKCETGGWSDYGVVHHNTTVRAWIAPYEVSPQGQALRG